jgi:hypothetical protein
VDALGPAGCRVPRSRSRDCGSAALYSSDSSGGWSNGRNEEYLQQSKMPYFENPQRNAKNCVVVTIKQSRKGVAILGLDFLHHSLIVKWQQFRIARPGKIGRFHQPQRFVIEAGLLSCTIRHHLALSKSGELGATRLRRAEGIGADFQQEPSRNL